MKCPKCGNENFFYSEEKGKANVKIKNQKVLSSVLILDIITFCFLIFSIIGYQRIRNFYYVDKIVLTISIILFITFLILTIAVLFIKTKFWYKESRTKATCENCWSQFYITPDTIEFKKGIEEFKK